MMKKHYVVAEGPLYLFLELSVIYLFTILLFAAPPCSKESCGEAF